MARNPGHGVRSEAHVPHKDASLSELWHWIWTYPGSFRGETGGNAVPVVEKLPERMQTAFPLLK